MDLQRQHHRTARLGAEVVDDITSELTTFRGTALVRGLQQSCSGPGETLAFQMSQALTTS